MNPFVIPVARCCATSGACSEVAFTAPFDPVGDARGDRQGAAEVVPAPTSRSGSCSPRSSAA